MDIVRAAGGRAADLEVSGATELPAFVGENVRTAAREAVREAGAIASGYFGRPHGRWEKGPGQIVTDADLAVDAFLKERLGP